MAMLDKDNLRATLATAVTYLLALAISILFIKQFTRKKKSLSCYLKTDISKPQYTFKRILADNSYSQFKHFKFQTQTQQQEDDLSNIHPYTEEVSKLLKNPNVGFFKFLDEYYHLREGLKMEMGDSYVWIENEEQLRDLVEVLSKESVFGVDTEQHSFRSFLGFTALIQISTIREDYLIDTIVLHDVIGLLRPVFANPEICKVFHGADNDVLWLQRDFHIYVVNLFDTAKACDVLSKPQRSLAYLLETYCDVSTNKLLQKEDWRRRPLPVEMLQYARMDAHYLLYISRCLYLELKLQKNENSSPGDKFHFILEASRRSNATCLQLFSKDVEASPGENAASSIISHCLNDQGNISPSLCDSKFQECVRRLCLWRDIMARLHDESLRFVLSENAIIALATSAPTTEKDICRIISKADQDVESMTLVSHQSPSPVVSCHSDDLLCLFQDSITNRDHIFELFIQQHLGPAGTCPLSAYNYALLSKIKLRITNRLTSHRNGFKASRQFTKRASRESFVKKFSCKSPVYHNCKIYANDGRLLCYSDRRKLEWYLNRNLAKLVEENPPSIMLLFEPKGRPEDEDNEFYIQSKKNICVGCGEGNHYLRYRVIPSCYRIHFPEHLKSHRSHDIVLLCVDCHEIAHAAAEKYKKQIAAEFGIPLFISNVVDFEMTHNKTSSLPVATTEEVGVSPLQLRTAAMALLRHGPQMPSDRREELMQVMMKYFGGREISEVDLERALLVGMSPHERKKFEKKRGYTFKHLPGCISSNNQKENNSGPDAIVSTRNVLKGETLDTLCTNMSDSNEKQDYDDILVVDDQLESTEPSCSNSGDDNDMSDTKIVPDISKELTVTAHTGDILLNHDTKFSLLGHGPHGKQVVEYLLKESGEDGVREFCQRWRQVLVEAINPRFLPAGWDVMHSGKRDFGEFSVYNPAKKASGIDPA